MEPIRFSGTARELKEFLDNAPLKDMEEEQDLIDYQKFKEAEQE